MVEKKTFDAILIKYMKKIPSLNYIVLLSNEGIPVSHVGRNKEKKKNLNSLGSLFRSLSTPAFNYQSSMALSQPIVSVTMVQEEIFLQIHLKDGMVGLIINKAMWPLRSASINELIAEISPYLHKILVSDQKTLLKDLYPKEETHLDNYLADAASLQARIMQCIDSFGNGTFSNYDWQIGESDPLAIYSAIGNEMNKMSITSVISVDDGKQLYSGYPNGSSEKICKINTYYLEDNIPDLTKLNYSEPLFEVFCFLQGEILLGGPIGQLENKRVELIIQAPNWDQGINQLVGPLYSAAVSKFAVKNSESSGKLINLLNYLMSDINDLREQIDENLSLKKNAVARDFMSRSSYLLQNQQEYSVSGDYQKWIAFTYFEEGNYPEAIKYYRNAAQDYTTAGDNENLAANLTDLASLYETIRNYGSALINYKQSEQLYTQLGAGSDDLNSISSKIDDLKTKVISQIKDFIGTQGKKIPMGTMAANLKYEIDDLTLILKQLIASGEVPGYINAVTETYNKEGKASSSGSAGTPKSFDQGLAKASSVGGLKQGSAMDYSNALDEANKIKKQNIKLDADLAQIEQKFKIKGVSMMEFLKYQARLEKKKINELKIRMFSEMLQFNDLTGKPSVCAICLNELDQNGTIIAGPNGHGFHDKCISQWVKTQDRCPACNTRLLPLIFKDYRDSGGESKGDVISSAKDKKSIQDLQAQVDTLKQSLGGDADIFDKLIAERENKDRLVSDLRKKDQIINELKSMLKAYKR
jgi:tetratricopeptide (TPR) repeat protein